MVTAQWRGLPGLHVGARPHVPAGRAAVRLRAADSNLPRTPKEVSIYQHNMPVLVEGCSL